MESMEKGEIVLQKFSKELKIGIQKREFEDIETTLAGLEFLQELPQLLDPYIEELIYPIAHILVRNLTEEPLTPFLASLYHIIYHLSKIRGAKIIGPRISSIPHYFLSV